MAGTLSRRIPRPPAGVRRAGRRARPVAGWIARIALWAVLAVGGGMLGLAVAGPIQRDTALGSASLRIEFSWHGQVDAYIPIADWGIRAHAFRAPIRIRIEPRGVDRQAVLRAAGGDNAVLRAAEKDAQDAAGAAIKRGLLYAAGGVLLGAALSALIRAAGPHRGAKRIAGWGLAPALIGALLLAAVVLRMQATFNTDAFDQPSFYARGAELAQLLQVSESKAKEAKQGYQSQVQRTLSGYAALLDAGAGLNTVPPQQPDAVLISDLHANTLVLGPFERLFAGRRIFFAGDLGQTGSRAEASVLVPRLEALGHPIVAVSGNHDSTIVMRKMAAAGIIVLTDTGRLRANGTTDGKPVQHIGALRVAGWPDPLEWHGAEPDTPSRVFSFSERPNGAQEYAQAQDAFVAWFDSLPERPEVVMVHENGLAQYLAETLQKRDDQRPLLILTGHDHQQHVNVHGRALVIDAGTAGAGGLFGVGSQFVGVATFQLEAGQLPPRTVDLIRVDPTSGAAQADRVVPSSKTACEVERVVCADEKPPKQPAP